LLFPSVFKPDETLAFIRRCARTDGGYDPSPDPAYEGNSDTKLSDLAGVTYVATLAKTMGWQLPHPERSIDFIQRRQTIRRFLYPSDRENESK
jgi:hypothetical protein